jgi:hypothetical protein
VNDDLDLDLIDELSSVPDISDPSHVLRGFLSDEDTPTMTREDRMALYAVEEVLRVYRDGIRLDPSTRDEHGTIATVIHKVGRGQRVVRLKLDDLQRVVRLAERLRRAQPCDCPLALEDPEIGPHSVGAHERDACNGHIHGPNPPCGGCFDCLLAQSAYYERKAKEATDG